MITDGFRTDDIATARQRIIEKENKGMLRFLTIGVPECDKRVIAFLAKHYIEHKGTNFDGIPKWLSDCLIAIPAGCDETPALFRYSKNARVISPDGSLKW